jgi:hypothetical protein
MCDVRFTLGILYFINRVCWFIHPWLIWVRENTDTLRTSRDVSGGNGCNCIPEQLPNFHHVMAVSILETLYIPHVQFIFKRLTKDLMGAEMRPRPPPRPTH